MIFPRSLSFRLLAGAVVWVTIALVVAGVALSRLFENHLEDQEARRFEVTLNQLAANLAVGDKGGIELTARLSEPQFQRPYSGLYWQVETARGEILLRSRSLWDRVLALPRDTLLDGEIHRHRLTGPDNMPLRVYERSVTLPRRQGRLRLAVGENATVLEGALAGFRRTLALSLGVLGLGLAGAAGVQVAGGLRPLRRLRNALGRVRSGRARRLEGRYPDEIQPLVDNLNAVLDQNEEVVARARTQAGNLAHSLKTPLAVLSNEAVALHDGDKDELARRIGEQVQLMQRRVDYHLVRARAAASVRVPGVRTDVREALEGLVRTMRKIYEARGINIDSELEYAPAFRGERQDFDEMAGNLLDNACKWATGEVRVHADATSDGHLAVWIDDDGPGLPEVRRAEVFSRGRRLDEGVAGSGLGLAVVAELAELYGGTVHLEDSPLGGVRAVLSLPAAG
ncbi:ATP-binding protein [Ferruginivarius sediminum]|uniref:histidine kinase n=1 Tax=Ferruginivarius sediminum TaxID=2661937 RepID=A0A369TBX4_9PROT|nr:ATP-binding protein [Ferruginivarius sediminum]RDD62780.1 HAMP domain-containing protein [Ferruginivarius sediminum]